MDVTVVIPLYNKAPHIQRTLNSILNQLCQPKEIIVVDDGSTDGGGEIVKSNSDARIKLIRQENSGASVARNQGISASSTELIAFIDADDEWKPEHLQKISDLIGEYPECGAYATSFVEDAGAVKIWRPKPQKYMPAGWKGIIDLDQYLELSTSIHTFLTSSVCVKKEVLLRVGMFDGSIAANEDMDLWLRILLVTHFAFLYEPFVIHYLNTVNRYRNIINPQPQIGRALEKVEQLMQNDTLPSKTRQLLYEFYCHKLLMRVPVALKDNFRDYAQVLLRKSAKTQKFKLRWFKWYFFTLIPGRFSSGYLERWISRG